MTEAPVNCPFCGARRLRIGSVAADLETEYQVICCECGASSGLQYTAAEAVEAWNEWAVYWTAHKFDIEIEVI